MWVRVERVKICFQNGEGGLELNLLRALLSADSCFSVLICDFEGVAGYYIKSVQSAVHILMSIWKFHNPFYTPPRLCGANFALWLPVVYRRIPAVNVR